MTKLLNFSQKLLRLLICTFYLTEISAVLIPVSSVAQEVSAFSGKVLNVQNHKPLPDVYIKHKSNNKVLTTTDKNGEFEIKNLQLPDTLFVSFVGFKTQKVGVSSRDSITILLEEDNREIENVMVYGNANKRQEKFLEVPESSSGVQIITAKKIEELRPNDLYDLFQTSLGLTISRQGSRVHNWVSGRGAGNSSMGFIIDGVFITQNQSTRMLGDISLDAIESVEIVRDASLVTMGPVSAGTSGRPNQGYIIMKTKQGTDKGTLVNASYGTWNTIKTSIFHGETITDKLSFGIGYSKSKNDEKTDYWGDWNNACDANMYWANIAYSTDKFNLKGTFIYNHTRRDIQRYQEEDGTWGTAVWTYDPIDVLHGGLDLLYTWNDQNITELSFGKSKTDGAARFSSTSRTDYFIDSMIVAEAREFEDRSTTANLLHAYHTGRNTLKTGSQLIYSYSVREHTGSQTTSPGSDYNLGIYASDEFKISPILVVDAGVRIDKKYIEDGSEKYTDDGVYTRTQSHMWVNDAWTGSVGVLCTPEKMLSLSGRISMTSTPTPTPTTMSTVDNKELPNERWTKYELGPVFSISDFLRLTVTGYYYDVKDAKTQAIDENGNHMTIVTEDGDAITVYDANKQLSRKGFEAMAEGKVLKYFNYNVGYSYFSSSLASEDTTMVRYKFTGMLGFHKDRVEATLSMVKVPEYWSNNAKVGNYTLWNANVGFDVTNKLKISLFARNLTDQKYATRYKGVGSGYFYDIGAIYGIEFKIKI